MIINYLLEFLSSFLTSICGSAGDFFSVNLGQVEVLTSLLSYGTWIVGKPILAAFALSVTFWMTVKFGCGLVLFVWRILPFT